MKPYGRTSNVKGFKGKIDYHIHIKNRKIGSWWEDYNGVSKKIERNKNRFFDENN